VKKGVGSSFEKKGERGGGGGQSGGGEIEKRKGGVNDVVRNGDRERPCQ